MLANQRQKHLLERPGSYHINVSTIEISLERKEMRSFSLEIITEDYLTESCYLDHTLQTK